MTVLQIQCILRYLGYNVGIDGVNGPNTMDAIETFQRDNGLTHDRVFGPMTEQKARYNFNNNIFKPAQAPAQSGTASAPVQKPAQAPTANNSNAAGFWKDIRYFTRTEFRCPCGKWCNGFPVEPKEGIVRFMDTMRGDLNTEIIIVPPDGHSGGSGVRCDQYNATLSGSASDSTHKQGRAVDFSARNASPATIEAYLSKAKAAGKIAYWYRINERSFHVNI